MAKEDNFPIFFPACQFCPSLQFSCPAFFTPTFLETPFNVSCISLHPHLPTVWCKAWHSTQVFNNGGSHFFGIRDLLQLLVLPAESQHLLPLLMSHAHAETRLDRSLASRSAALLCILPNSPMITCALAWSTSMNCFNAIRGPNFSPRSASFRTTIPSLFPFVKFVMSFYRTNQSVTRTVCCSVRWKKHLLVRRVPKLQSLSLRGCFDKY